MKRLLIILGLLAVFACRKEEAPVVSVDVTVDEIGPCVATFTATLNSKEELEDAFFIVYIADEPSVNSRSAQRFTTNYLSDGKMRIKIKTLNPLTVYTFRTRFIHHGVNYDTKNRDFTTADLPVGTIDMGLSVKWASTNLGSSSLSDSGDKYAWGETEPKESFSWENYKWCDGTESGINKYNKEDGLTTLQPEDDAARGALGGGWRMPTGAEYLELIENSYWAWIEYNTVSGLAATSRINGNTLFFPTYEKNKYSSIGYYWSASSQGNSYALSLLSENDLVGKSAYLLRCEGAAIRPVLE